MDAETKDPAEWDTNGTKIGTPYSIFLTRVGVGASSG